MPTVISGDTGVSQVQTGVVTPSDLSTGAPSWDASGNATVFGAIRSSTTNPPTFQNTSGVEIGTLCRAWVNFNGVTTATVRASYNVSSVTRNGTGDYTVNFTSALSDANYAVAVTAGLAGTVVVGRAAPSEYTTNSAGVLTTSVTSAATDCPFVNVAIFR